MKLEISINGFKYIFVMVCIALIISIFLPEPLNLWVVYISLFIVLASYYMRRDSLDNKYHSKHKNPINFAFTVLILGAFYYYHLQDLRILSSALTLASSGMTLAYVLQAFRKANRDANTQEVYKIKEWDVYSDRRTENPIPTTMNVNIVGETLVTNQVSFDDAILLLKKLYAEGKEPQAVSSKPYGGLSPKIDHNGEFIGFKYDSKVVDTPFTMK